MQNTNVHIYMHINMCACMRRCIQKGHLEEQEEGRTRWSPQMR